MTLPNPDYQDVEDALATLIEGDTDIAAYMAANDGHFLLSRETDKRAQDFSGRDCPLIKLQWEGFSCGQATNRSRRVDLRFKVLIASGSRSSDQAKFLCQMVTDCLDAEAGERPPLGIAAVFLLTTAPAAVSAAHENIVLDEAGVEWEQAISVTVTLWRTG